jgi:hypothetical protein
MAFSSKFDEGEEVGNGCRNARDYITGTSIGTRNFRREDLECEVSAGADESLLLR